MDRLSQLATATARMALEDAGLAVTPYHENVPSFGDWGWFLGRHPKVKRNKLNKKIVKMEIPVDTRFLTPEVFKRQLVFGKSSLETSKKDINTLKHPILLSLYTHDAWQVE